MRFVGGALPRGRGRWLGSGAQGPGRYREDV